MLLENILQKLKFKDNNKIASDCLWVVDGDECMF